MSVATQRKPFVRSHPGTADVWNILLKQVRARPENTAFRFLSNGRTGESSVTYSELETKSRALGNALIETCVPGDRILLMLPPGFDYIVSFFACLYAGAVAVPLFPPKPGRDNSRIESVASSAEPAAVLVPEAQMEAVRSSSLSAASLSRAAWLSPDVKAESAGQIQGGRRFNPLAYLQYTSGSTRIPRGVMVTHANLLHNMESLYSGWDHDPESKLLSWLPPFHDMGLIYGLLTPIYGGFQCYLMSPGTFLQRPASWLEIISQVGITHAIGPNFAYEICNQKVEPSQIENLNLHSWKVAVNGAETVRSSTLARFADKFEPYGFRANSFCPGYGLAENTLKVSSVNSGETYRTLWLDKHELERDLAVTVPYDAPNSTSVVGCGKAPWDTEIRIVNPLLRTERAGGEIGEIWIRGGSVAGGYWNEPEETDIVFGAMLEDTNEGPFLRTGDLGFLERGELFITGRIKDLIVVRGRNCYPTDIEVTVQNLHPAFRAGGGAAFSAPREEGEQIVLVQELSQQSISTGSDIEDLIESIRSAVAREHDIDLDAIVFIEPRSLPKTSSGKIQRNETRKRFLAGTLETIVSWKPQEKRDAICLGGDFVPSVSWLRSLTAGTLGVPEENIPTTEPLSAHGVSSLSALRLCHSIEKLTTLHIPPFLFLGDGTLEDIALKLKESKRVPTDAFASNASSVELRTTCELTPAQRGLLHLEQQADVAGVYNISCALQVKGSLDARKLMEAVHGLAKRHRILTARLTSLESPKLEVNGESEIGFHIISAEGFTEEQLRAKVADESYRSFSLLEGPLSRVMVFSRGLNDDILLFTVHHLVSDLWSMSIWVEELFDHYRGNSASLQAGPDGFGAWARHCDEVLKNTELEGPAAYWNRELRGPLPLLNFPTDKKRPARLSFAGEVIDFRISAELTQAIQKLALQTRSTVPIILLAAYQAVLCRYSDQEEVVVGTTAAGRDRVDTEHLGGYFVNTVPIRGAYQSSTTFEQFVTQVRSQVYGAWENQRYPFASMVNKLETRDPNRPPIFQAFYTFQQAPNRLGPALSAASAGAASIPIDVPGLDIRTFDFPVRTSQFELTLNVAYIGPELAVRTIYNPMLFCRERIDRFCNSLTLFLDSAVTNPKQRIARIPIVDLQEHEAKLRGWDSSGRIPDALQPLHVFIDEQARKTPDAVAVVDDHGQISYRQLLKRADLLAHMLHDRGVGPEVLVGVCIERSFELVISLLAVLKAGGAYVALDPDVPGERLAEMIAAARPLLIIVDQRQQDRLRAVSISQLVVGGDWSNNGMVANKPSPPAIPGNAAYVIFTSGSTGKPKGVVNTHKGIVNRLLWMQESYRLTTNDRILQKTPIGFDVSVWEFFWPLMNGAAIVLARPGGHQDLDYLEQYASRQNVTVMHFVPSMLRRFLDRNKLPPTLRLLTASGEVLSADIPPKVLENTGAELHNLYGPTEAAVDVTSWKCLRETEPISIPIGKAIANIEIHILDREMNMVPVGVVGELYIAGLGVARGYIGRPDLTAERFVPCPVPTRWPGYRMYRTGDLARYREDGAVEYLGRIDHQVKVRGCRVELSELEAVCSAVPGVTECAANAGWVQDGAVLVLYIVASDRRIDARVILEHLRRHLPTYMLPNGIVFVAALPRLPNGKIDRAGLPLWSPDTAQENVAEAVSDTEKWLVNVWKEALGVSSIGRTDNFFELGGHSLHITEVAIRIREQFQIELPMTTFFEALTVAELAAEIEGLRGHEKEPDIADFRFTLYTPDVSATGSPSVQTRSCALTCLSKQEKTQRTVIVSVPTAGRSQQLLRCVESWIDNERLSAPGSCIVIVDDSRTADHREEITTHFARITRKTGVEIEYRGCAETAAFVERLAAQTSVESNLISFALLGDELGLVRTGANRNNILLQLSGRRFLSVDDDTIQRIAAAPCKQNEAKYSGSNYPPSIYPMPSRDAMWKKLQWVRANPLELLDDVLGKSGHELGVASAGLVMAACFGSAGDCGWGSPSNYLFINDDSFSKLVETAKDYQAGCRSREMIQAVSQLTLGEPSDYMMSMFLGLDGSNLLPPFLPVARGQDAVFGTMLRLMYGGQALVAYLPWLLPHIPEKARTFSAGEITRSASGITLAELVAWTLNSFEGSLQGSPEHRLTEIGNRLRAVAAFPAQEFSHFLKDIGKRRAEHLGGIVTDRLSRFGAGNELWQQDGRRFLALLDKSNNSAGAGLPLDVHYGRSSSEATDVTQRILEKFGRMVQLWPELMRGAMAFKPGSISGTNRLN
ncbi:MAG TPA: amino acid adenylation domain-containing protein [Bryobacteraceae bacterium]|nr:amino acid adenylation domain-containing protein [Bryobacteraceae bacterium]